MKAKIMAAFVVIALLGTVGTAFALDTASVTKSNADDQMSDTGEQNAYTNGHEWKHQYKPQCQHNEDGAQESQNQDMSQNRYQYQYKYNETCDNDGNQFKHQYKNEGENPNDPDCDQSQDRFRHRNQDHERPGPGPDGP